MDETVKGVCWLVLLVLWIVAIMADDCFVAFLIALLGFMLIGGDTHE